MTTNYEIKTEWSHNHWTVRLIRTTYSFWLGSYDYKIIKSDRVKSEKERDEIINDYKINKMKYINTYECNERKNQTIPI